MYNKPDNIGGARDKMLEQLSVLDGILNPTLHQPQEVRTYTRLQCWINNTILDIKIALLTARTRRLALKFLKGRGWHPIIEEYIEECEDFEGPEYWLLYHGGRFPGTIDRLGLIQDLCLYVIHSDRHWNV